MRVLYVGVGLLILLAVVAAASRGHAPVAGGGDSAAHTRAASQILFDIVFTLAVIGTISAVLLMAFVRARSPGGGTGSVRSAVVLTVVVAVFSLFAVFGGPALYNRARQNGRSANPSLASAAKKLKKARRPEAPQLNWPFAGALIALLLAAGAIPLYRVLRRRDEVVTELRLAQELAEILDDTLDDLRAEPDPRRAVIAAYARMEQALAVHGLPRREAEAPLEYLGRILLDLTVSEQSVTRLTELFERAKFSTHTIGPELKDEAIDALAALRDDLRAIDRPSDDTPPLRRPVGLPS
jgi:hypothetical protein